MNDNGNITYIRTIEQHSNDKIFYYDVFKVNNDCGIYELNGRSVFPFKANKGDFIYLNKTECNEWTVEHIKNTSKCYTHITVYDIREEYLVAYKAVLSLPDGTATEVINSEIIKKGNFNNMKDQIKAWIAVLEIKYNTLKNINIISFSKY